jgi:hypothetical protein
MSKKSPSHYQRLDVANATLDAAEDYIEELQAELKIEREKMRILKLKIELLESKKELVFK